MISVERNYEAKEISLGLSARTSAKVVDEFVETAALARALLEEGKHVQYQKSLTLLNQLYTMAKLEKEHLDADAYVVCGCCEKEDELEEDVEEDEDELEEDVEEDEDEFGDPDAIFDDVEEEVNDQEFAGVLKEALYDLTGRLYDVEFDTELTEIVFHEKGKGASVAAASPWDMIDSAPVNVSDGTYMVDAGTYDLEIASKSDEEAPVDTTV